MPPKRKKAKKATARQKQSQTVIVNVGAKSKSGRGKLPPPSYQNNLARIQPQQQIDYTPLLLSMMQQQSKVPIQATTQPPINNIVPPILPSAPAIISAAEAAADAAIRRAGITASNFQSQPSTQTFTGDMEAIQTSRKTQTEPKIVKDTEMQTEQFSSERAKNTEQLEVREPDQYVTDRLVMGKPDPLSRTVSDISQVTTLAAESLSRSVSDISQVSTVAAMPSGFVEDIKNTTEYKAIATLTRRELESIALNMGLPRHAPRRVEDYRINIVKKQLGMKI